MKTLTRVDALTLNASEGWLMLGNVAEAFEELRHVSPEGLLHPIGLTVVWKALFASERWDEALQVAKKLCQEEPRIPSGWICLSQSLAHAGRTVESKSVLESVASEFEDNKLIPYLIACLYCRLGEISDAWSWLESAFERDKDGQLHRIALQEEDLKPLQEHLRSLAA
jgi:hypothetical protein